MHMWVSVFQQGIVCLALEPPEPSQCQGRSWIYPLLDSCKLGGYIYIFNFFPMTGMQRLIPETFHCSGALPPPSHLSLLLSSPSFLCLSPPLSLPPLPLPFPGRRTRAWVLQAALGEAGAAGRTAPNRGLDAWLLTELT